MTKKIIPFEINLKSSQRAGFTFQPRPQILTNDANAAELNFIITDTSTEELAGSTATVLLFMKDGSFFQNTDVTRFNNIFSYVIKPNQAKHKGVAQVQLVVKNGSVENASPLMEVDIVGGLESKPIVEREIQDWTSLTAEAKAFVEQIEGFTLESFVENKMGQELANLEVNYATRLTGLEQKDNQLTAQLAQSVEKIPNVANAKERLKILNVYGDYENIHPKVLYFPNGLWGYRYWMAFTPYPGGDIKKENPSLAVSNSGVLWTNPFGLDRGLLVDWTGVEGEYNNDTHLVYREDLGRLEVWWRLANSVTKVVHLKRKTTTDGKVWTDEEIMFTGTQDTDDHISPAVIFEDGKYKMLSIQSDLGWKVFYSESANGVNWSPRVTVNIDLSRGRYWHIDFIKSDLGYELIGTFYNASLGQTTNTARLFYAVSKDLLTFEKPMQILEPSPLVNAWDNQGIYRSSIVKINGVYHIYYSAVRQNAERGMGLAYGKSITALKGFDYDVGAITDLTFSNATQENVKIKSNDTILNTLDVVQMSDNTRFGGIKVGNLLFDNGLTSGVPPQEGSVRFNGVKKNHESYTNNTWSTLAPKLMFFGEINAVQSLTNGAFTDVIFPRELINLGHYANGTFTANESGYYRIVFGINLIGLVDGDSLEVQIKNASTGGDIRLIYKQKLPVVSGGAFVFGESISSISPGVTFKLSLKHEGAGSAKITQYPSQNFISVERY